MATRHLTFQRGLVSDGEREALLGQRGCVLWLTGLSGSGKSTIARALERRLTDEKRLVYVLDGDNLRHGLSADLGFSDHDRAENIRRAGEVAALFADAGVLVVTAFISPFRADRARVRQLVPEGRFLEIFIDAPIEVCEGRDPKGLYRRAREGEIEQFTGISSPYETPTEPDLLVRTDRETVDQAVERIVALLAARCLIGHRARKDTPLL